MMVLAFFLLNCPYLYVLKENFSEKSQDILNNLKAKTNQPVDYTLKCLDCMTQII